MMRMSAFLVTVAAIVVAGVGVKAVGDHGVPYAPSCDSCTASVPSQPDPIILLGVLGAAAFGTVAVVLVRRRLARRTTTPA